jgi:hypothetical protein
MRGNGFATERTVAVVVSGLPVGSAVGVRVANREPSRVDRMRYQFDNIPFGPQQITWAQGERCRLDTCPGPSCPAWCGRGDQDLDVVSGSGTQITTLDLMPAAPRRVRINTPELSDLSQATFTLGEVSGRAVEGGLLFDDVPPGNHTLLANVGDCDRSAVGCWPEGACPDGCTSSRDKLAVPWGTGEFVHELALPAPAEQAPIAARNPTPDAAPTPQPSRGAVTVAQFAGWLASNPAWHRDAAIAEGKAKGQYLPGWVGAKPPVGVDGAVKGVSWHAANQYCRSHGGLADIDAPPLRWVEASDQPYIEYRASAGRASWRTNDGRTSPHLDPATVAALTGFRCAR